MTMAAAPPPGVPRAPPPSVTEFSAGARHSRPLPVDALAALEKRAFSRSDAWSVDDLRAEAKKTSALLVLAFAAADDPTTLLGYLAASSTGTAIHILRVATHPGARRRGVAAALVGAALQPDPATTRRRRPLAATLHVDPANAPAVALYTRAGFTVDAKLADYYAVGRDAWRMAVLL